MDGNDTSNWIANLNRVEGGWCADLGYFVGARICEAYYERAADKRKAVRDLMFVTDAKAILRLSRYEARFESRTGSRIPDSSAISNR